MRSVRFANVYNRCFALSQTQFTKMINKKITHPDLRTRYHWSKHVRKMLDTKNPSLRFDSFTQLTEIDKRVSMHFRINEIAFLQSIRRVQRYVLRWLFRPHGPIHLRVLVPRWEIMSMQPEQEVAL